jgi:hypothetical protein
MVRISTFEVRGSGFEVALHWRLDVGCWKFGLHHKLLKSNSPLSPPSWWSGGTLDKLWTCPVTVEPSQGPVFHQAGLSNSPSCHAWAVKRSPSLDVRCSMRKVTAYPFPRQMAVESKPLFHPEVLHQQVWSFNLPEQSAPWQPKLQHWADLIASGRAAGFKETALLSDFLTDIFCGLLRLYRPGRDRRCVHPLSGTPRRGGLQVRRCRPGPLPGGHRGTCCREVISITQ